MSKKVFPMELRLLSVVPCAGGRNAMTIDDKRKIKVTTLDQFVDSELFHMKAKLETLGCNDELARRLLTLYEETLHSADMPLLQPPLPKKRKLAKLAADDKQ